MTHLDIDFAIPIALLAASIVGVVLVRVAASRGRRSAKERTRRLLERFGTITAPGGMDEDDRASSPSRPSTG